MELSDVKNIPLHPILTFVWYACLQLFKCCNGIHNNSRPVIFMPLSWLFHLLSMPWHANLIWHLHHFFVDCNLMYNSDIVHYSGLTPTSVGLVTNIGKNQCIMMTFITSIHLTIAEYHVNSGHMTILTMEEVQ